VHDAVGAHLVLVCAQLTLLAVSLEVYTDVLASFIDERRCVSHEVVQQHSTELSQTLLGVQGCSQQPVVTVLRHSVT